MRARPDGTRRVISLRTHDLQRRFPGLLELIRAVRHVRRGGRDDEEGHAFESRAPRAALAALRRRGG